MIHALGSMSVPARLPDFPMASAGPAARPQAAAGDFGATLAQFGATALDTLKQGEAAALQGVQGAMPVQQVVDQVLAAERTLQAGLAIRDKLVSAFLDISRMQI